jgi:hypothetical protein
MASLIAWLDASAAETQRMREIVKLFGTPESVDDLALGQFRDSVSNSLFPGTSVLHVAARYLLLIPWCFQSARNAKTGEQLRLAGEWSERRLIRRFQELGFNRFIGRLAGESVAQLPSAAYWTALRTWGIVRGDVERSAIGDAMLDEADARRDGLLLEPVWHAGLPPMPEGFPATEEYGMELDRGEAEWIRERLLATVHDSLLGQLIANPKRVLKTSEVPWEDPSAAEATGDAIDWLTHAEAYSALQHGLDATYFLLVAREARRRLGSLDEDTESQVASMLGDWHADDNQRRLLRAWDTGEFITRARTSNPRIQPASAAFLTQAVKELASAADPAANVSLHRLVRNRERQAKSGNSRFVNERRLRVWYPPEGINRQAFRWPVVRTMLIDIREGLARA